MIDLGHAVKFVADHAKLVLCPAERFSSQRFAACADDAQGQVILTPWIWVLCQPFDGCGSQKSMGHFVAAHEVVGIVCREAFQRCHHRAPRHPGWEQHIKQSAYPSPIRGGPIDRIRIVKGAIEEQIDGGRVGRKNPVAVHDPFGFASGARSIHQKRRIIGPAKVWDEIRGGVFHSCAQIDVVSAWVAHHDMAQVRELFFAQWLPRVAAGQDDSSLAIVERMGKGVRAVKLGEGHCDAADLGDCHMANPRVGVLAGVKRDRITFAIAQTAKFCGKTCGGRVDLGKALGGDTAIRGLIDHRGFVALLRSQKTANGCGV